MSISLILSGSSDKASNILKHITNMSYEAGIYDDAGVLILL